MSSLSSLVNVYEYSTNRSTFALKVMEQRLALGGEDLAELVAQVRGALEAAQAVRALEERWKGSRGQVLHGGEARRLDAELDRVLGALDSALGSALRAWGDDEPLAAAATQVRARLFPRGVAHLIHLPYVEAAEEVEVLLARAEGEPEVVAALGALGLGIYLDRVREVHARYVEALQPVGLVSWDEIRDGRREVHERFCAIVCLIAGRKHLADPDSVEALVLEGALQVVWEQNRAVRIARQRRRRPPDVDPETGGELADEDLADEDGFEPEAPATVELPPIAQPLVLPSLDRGVEDVA